MKKNHYDCTGKNNGMFERSHTKESLEKMSISVKNRKKIKCEYCGKEMNKLNYIKWHGENCKLKPCA
jgi:aspartate carbamoyltransferase regulatory subunit